MKSLVKLKSFCAFLLLLIFALNGYAQTKPDKSKKVNFDYSKNPPTRVTKQFGSKNKPIGKEVAAKKAISVKTKPPAKTGSKRNLSLAQKTRDIAREAAKASLLPTEIYKVGAEDVLFVALQNVSFGSSRYYTVLKDGTIDYPLAGGLLSVAGLTTDEIEELLRAKIKLYENPQVAVKVREYTSHKITVLGQVERPGDMFLQRDAMPLYVIRAQALAKSGVNQIVLKRKDSRIEIFDLAERKYEKVLVFPGDIVEFKNSNLDYGAQGNQHYYIGGFVRKFGRKEFYKGITLTQAILISGGLKQSKTNKVVIRRRNLDGLLESKVYRLKDIRKGKISDPILAKGDMIERQ